MAYQTLLKSWGDPGVEWNDGWAFNKDEPLPAEWGNFLIDNLIKDVQHLIDHTNTLDPDGDGTVVNADKVDGLDASQLGGFNYVTTSRPTASTLAETWFHTESNLLRIWNGSDWKAQPAVRRYSNYPAPRDEYETIHESPYQHTQRYNDKIELVEEIVFADFESGVDPVTESRGEDSELNYWSAWTGDRGDLSRDRAGAITGTFSGKLHTENDRVTVSTTHQYGIEQYFEFTAKVGSDTLSINDTAEFVFYNESGAEIGRIIFHDGAGNVEFVGSTATEVMSSWTPDQAYTFLLEWDFGADSLDLTIDGGTLTSHTMANTSIKFAKFEAINDTISSQEPRDIWIDGLTQGPHMSGEAIIKIEQPEFITDWSFAQFIEDETGGNVVVDIENTADGSTLISDYSSGDDLSQAVPAGVEPQLRIALTRSSYAGNPAFTGFDLQWTLDAERVGKWVTQQSEQAKNTALVAGLLL